VTTIARLLHGDAIELVSHLEYRLVDCVATSSSYFHARAYSDDVRELGRIDQSLDEFRNYLVALFRALLPKLTPHAAIWLNVGDRFAGGGFGEPGPKLARRASWDGMIGPRNRQKPPAGYHDRDFLPVSALVADALREQVPLIGRGEIVWDKSRAIEAPRRDRVSRSHEMVYLFTPKHPNRSRNPREGWVDGVGVEDPRRKLRTDWSSRIDAIGVGETLHRRFRPSAFGARPILRVWYHAPGGRTPWHRLSGLRPEVELPGAGPPTVCHR
jgi:hypothetical protein